MDTLFNNLDLFVSGFGNTLVLFFFSAIFALMHWVIPAAMLGMAWGSSIRVSNWRREQPNALPASSSSWGTSRMPR